MSHAKNSSQTSAPAILGMLASFLNNPFATNRSVLLKPTHSHSQGTLKMDAAVITAYED
ncbi:hypothetical protein K431DRAFT_289241 [Polychaeton citri CBS 116435]|uniref:Uncharacterized protein n=1 Tax=Polychaeton citri CBS 116435 TaxID=1314669 RepID=A0A9P4UL75_9PEZI|nr:hypothetical protein K431DRAFT_289241 [Polychaeton citri CBS 116435]